MRTLHGLFAAAVVSFALALPSLADDLITADGTSHACEILKVDEDGVTARGKLKSGDVVEVKVPVARLDPLCYYALRDAAIGSDGKARLRFAVWCVENELFSRAKIQVRKAGEADPKLLEDIQAGKFPEIREGIAKRVLASAESDLAAGRLAPAREKVEMLLGRLSDTEAGSKARDVIRTIDAKETEAEAKAAAEAAAKLGEEAKKAEEARAKLLAAVDESYTKGKALAMEGLVEDSDVKALDLLEKALGHGDDALQKLDSIERLNAGDAALLEEAKARRAKTLAGMVKIRVHRADVYIWRGSLVNAKKELDAARKLVPSSPEIDAAAQRLLAADEDDPQELRYLRERRETGSRFGGRAGGGGGRGR